MAPRMIGCARRVRVKLPLGKRLSAWDCRPFGFGRIVTRLLPMQIKLDRQTRLDIRTGEVRRVPRSLAA